jgi:hypothetical protein
MKRLLKTIPLTLTSSTCSVDYLFRDLDPGVIRPCPDATLASAIPAAAEGCSHAALVGAPTGFPGAAPTRFALEAG